MSFLSDIFAMFAGIQSNGGEMAVLVYIAMKIKSLDKWTEHHEELYVHTERRARPVYDN